MLLSLFTLASAELQNSYAILRHGQSLANVEGVISSDPRVACIAHGLSNLGQEQAVAAAADVAATVASEGFDGVAIVSSDLRRAWQTASIVHAEVRAAGVRVWPHDGVLEARTLRERSFGELSGQSDDRYPDVWAEDAVSATHDKFGVEPVLSVRERARYCVTNLEGSLPPGRWLVVLVAHGDVLQIAQTAFVKGGMDPRHHRSLPHLQTATLRLVARAGDPWSPPDLALIDPRWRRDAEWPPRESAEAQLTASLMDVRGTPASAPGKTRVVFVAEPPPCASDESSEAPESEMNDD